MRRYVIRLLLAFFETVAATLMASIALYLRPFLKAFHHRDTTFDPGLPRRARK